ncbi:hypothetical protein HDV00_005454 [Rhizophlyctis rosea]|nr:hypothetical protein HDV00_005454 [Rhizophlyctis rosea]
MPSSLFTSSPLLPGPATRSSHHHRPYTPFKYPAHHKSAFLKPWFKNRLVIIAVMVIVLIAVTRFGKRDGTAWGDGVSRWDGWSGREDGDELRRLDVLSDDVENSGVVNGKQGGGGVKENDGALSEANADANGAGGKVKMEGDIGRAGKEASNESAEDGDGEVPVEVVDNAPIGVGVDANKRAAAGKAEVDELADGAADVAADAAQKGSVHEVPVKGGVVNGEMVPKNADVAVGAGSGAPADDAPVRKQDQVVNEAVKGPNNASGNNAPPIENVAPLKAGNHVPDPTKQHGGVEGEMGAGSGAARAKIEDPAAKHPQADGQGAQAGDHQAAVQDALDQISDSDPQKAAQQPPPAPNQNSDNVQDTPQPQPAQNPQPPPLAPPAPPNPTPPPPTRHPLSNIAIALKTGHDIALTRIPIQLLTFLHNAPHLLLIAEDSSSVGPYPVIDVYTPHNGNASPDTKGPSFMAEYWKKEMEDQLKGMKPGEERVVVDKNNKGWQADAHKNLPGFGEMRRKFLDGSEGEGVEWFLMIDDDTYVFPQNLAHFTSTEDPTTPLYFGAPNIFTGCDDVRKMGDGPLFAHGGSGILMSRAALELLTDPPHLQKCITKYRDCWAGDVRTALCLRDAGVLLTRHPAAHFHGDPPSRTSFWPRDPCEKPLTFHHLLPSQIQNLYNTPSQNLTTYGAILQHLRPSLHIPASNEMEMDVNREGGDYKDVPSGSGEECRRKCERDEGRCVSWTFDVGRCWLKEGVVGGRGKRGAVSGVFGERYVCRE